MRYNINWLVDISKATNRDIIPSTLMKESRPNEADVEEDLIQISFSDRLREPTEQHVTAC